METIEILGKLGFYRGLCVALALAFVVLLTIYARSRQELEEMHAASDRRKAICDGLKRCAGILANHFIYTDKPFSVVLHAECEGQIEGFLDIFGESKAIISDHDAFLYFCPDALGGQFTYEVKWHSETKSIVLSIHSALVRDRILAVMQARA